MKILVSISIAFFLTIISCSGGKNITLDTNPVLRIENPYWQEIIPGQEDGVKSVILILPYSMAIANYGVDSVFFHGYHEPLVQSTINEGSVYRVQLFPKDTDIAIKPPYTFLENEALVSYFDNENIRHYFKVRNIIRKEPMYMP